MNNPPDNGLALSLKAIALLLHYPDGKLQANCGEITDVLLARPELYAAERAALERFAAGLREADPYEVQAEYVATFDHSKKVSLYLFEHVYGESRDRGPAMVELINAYREKGLEISGGLLPDYLPLFLEFCAGLPEQEARDWLADIARILQQIHVRLVQRQSDYALPFLILLRLAGLDPAPDALRREAAAEERDDTPAAFDSIWMEAPVTFGPEQPTATCGGAGGRPQEAPIQWRPHGNNDGRQGRT